MIKLYNVNVSFFGERKVLDSINLKVAPGEFLYVTGESGAGKSTMLRLIYADLPTTRGIVTVYGQNVGTMKPNAVPYLRRAIGVVFQDFKLLEEKTVYENICMALEIYYLKPSLVQDKIHTLLRRLGIFVKRDTQVKNLSGGEKQRVAIARALINEPKVILADEPTGNLDDHNADIIMSLLLENRDKGSAVLVATHDKRLMEKFPARTIELKNGKISYDTAGITQEESVTEGAYDEA
jgi:cell division transport system ATP-binding protein